MNMWPSQWNLGNCEVARKRLQWDSNLWPLTFALQCSTSWAIKTHTLEAGQFIEFINPWKEWNTEWNDVNSGNTDEMNMWHHLFCIIVMLCSSSPGMDEHTCLLICWGSVGPADYHTTWPFLRRQRLTNPRKWENNASICQVNFIFFAICTYLISLLSVPSIFVLSEFL